VPSRLQTGTAATFPVGDSTTRWRRSSANRGTLPSRDPVLQVVQKPNANFRQVFFKLANVSRHRRRRHSAYCR